MIPLSKLKPYKNHTNLEIIDLILHWGYIGVINDLTPAPNVEYELDDLIKVWDKLKLYI